MRLPHPLTPFVGRAREVDDLLGLLSSGTHRLVTLTSPGGMGKTRLALETAAQAEARGLFADGVAFASAEACATAGELAAEVARAVGYVYANWDDAGAQLLGYLSGKSALLVLDNLEHVTGEAAALIAGLLDAPGVVVLATSRERLRLSAETVYPLAGMAHDAPESDAVALFAQAAERACPGLTLRDADRAVAAEVCAALGGMPLGIVLAASWLETLPLADLLAEIRAGAGFLSADFADMPARHHRLDDLLRATWARLAPPEQAAMTRLAVFRGGFTRGAAHDAAETPAVMLKSLMSRSLIWRDPSRGRYHQHPLLRQFAAAHGDTTDAAERHAACYEALLTGLTPALRGGGQRDALRAFADDAENIRAAWAHALAQRQFERLDAMLDPLALALNLSCQWRIAETLLREACSRLSDADAPDALLGRALARWVESALLSGDPSTPLPELRRWADRARQIALNAECAADIATALRVSALLATEMDDPDAVEALLREALPLAEAPYERAEIIHMLGYVAHQRRETDVMLDYSRQSVELLRSAGEELLRSTSLVNMGSAHMWRGDYPQARACFDEAMRIGRAHGNWWRELLAEQCLGSLAFHTGDIGAVKESARLVVETSTHYGYRDGIALATHNLVMALLAEGSTIAAWQMLGQDTLLAPVDRALGLALCELTLGDTSAARAHLRAVLTGGDERRWPYALGAAAGVYIQHGALEPAVELLSLMAHTSVNTAMYMQRVPLYANLRAYLEGKLPPAAFAAAWARGKTAAPKDLLPRVLAQLDDGPRRQRSDADALSPREREIVGLVAAGLSNQDIADALVVGLSTVKKHLTHIYAKLGVASRTQALIKAREAGLV